MKNVADFKLISGNRIIIRNNGTVFCSSQNFWNVASWVWLLTGVSAEWLVALGHIGSEKVKTLYEIANQVTFNELDQLGNMPSCL